MKTIKIKRLTKDGVLECEGLLLNQYDFQFCIFEFEPTNFHLIELSSGASLAIFHCIKADYMKLILKSQRIFKIKTRDEIFEGIKRFKRINKKIYNVEFPLNEKIL